MKSHREEIKDLFKAAISVDCVVFGYSKGELQLLTIHSELDKYAAMHSLVGGLVFSDESLEDAAARVLEQRAGLKNVPLEQIRAFGRPDRHPVGRVITVAFFAVINAEDFPVDARQKFQPEWTSLKLIKEMAFDHMSILKICLRILRHRFIDDVLFANLLPEKFTLSELQHLAESVLNTKLDKRNFRKKMLNSDHLMDTHERQSNVNHRPAKLYRVNHETFDTCT